jgi:hypothetical protein
LDKLFANPQKVVFLVGSFLYDVEKSIFHHNLGNIHELFVQKHPFMVRIISFVIMLVLIIVNLNQNKFTFEPIPTGGDELIISTKGIYYVSSLETSY